MARCVPEAGAHLSDDAEPEASPHETDLDVLFPMPEARHFGQAERDMKHHGRFSGFT